MMRSNGATAGRHNTSDRRPSVGVHPVHPVRRGAEIKHQFNFTGPQAAWLR
jgi:hypothetical protein